MQPFRDSTDLIHDGPALGARVAEDGYLFFRGLIPPADILAARRRMLDLIDAAGWLDRDSPDDLAAVTRPNAFVLDTDPVATELVLRQSVLAEVLRLQHHPVLLGLFDRLFGEAVLPLPRVLVRNMFPRQDEHTTPQHQDFPHVQGSERLMTCWLPVGDCDAEMGGLAIAAGSSRLGVLPIEPSLGAGGMSVPGDFTNDWVWNPFGVGDVVVFSCLTVHRGVPNRSNRMRISVDFRYQPLADPVTEEWLTPHRRATDWETLYRALSDDTHKYYWRKLPLTVAAWDPRWYADRDAQAFVLAERGDRRALATLRRIAAKDPDPAQRARAEQALAAFA
jgi:hypothetical protein